MSESATAFPYLIRAQLLQMLSAIERTGGVAISLESLNAFAYFANVLSPLWEIEPVEGSVLKDGAPRFPALEAQLDQLVGAGLVDVASLSVEAQLDAPAKLIALFRINHIKAAPVLKAIQALPDERSSEGFLLELAAAFLDIAPDRQDDAAIKDAAYSNPKVSAGRVVDFAEWVSPTRGNASWNVAQTFQRYVPEEVTLNRAEKLVMYMSLMKRRANG
ncbi:hypothetical protein [Rhodovarius lipocyclicus]|uniref:hypothetical protein n=1 Tax=Rhodovarius lipocyclicus TaxID=268410 RepID=UPI001356B45E|nr:hypothetical protein [Rhodovarius lipocyclicus]